MQVQMGGELVLQSCMGKQGLGFYFFSTLLSLECGSYSKIKSKLFFFFPVYTGQPSLPKSYHILI